ncbi:MAG: hypothetical protein PHI63_02610 [Patescibacteria group bacterium]|nr:hypothetical protein [Patescibacteria group bacterium]
MIWNKKIFITTLACMSILGLAGCTRQPAPAAPQNNAQLPASQLAAIPTPKPSVDPALLDDGLDGALKDLDAVQ